MVHALVRGENLTFKIAEQNDYKVDNIDVDGSPLGPKNVHEFLNINSDHSIIITSISPTDNSLEENSTSVTESSSSGCFIQTAYEKEINSQIDYLITPDIEKLSRAPYTRYILFNSGIFKRIYFQR